MIGFSEIEYKVVQDMMDRMAEALNDVIEALRKVVGKDEQKECPYPESLIYPIYVVQRYIAPSLYSNRHWHIRDPPGVIHNLVI